MKNCFCLILLFCSGSILSQFTDITAEAGLRHNCSSEILMGGGVAFIDYDNDGWQDLAFTGGDVADKLYRNLADGTFEDVSYLLSKPVVDHITTSVVSGDLNNDGCDDLFFTTWDKEGSDYILRNDCMGGFELILLPSDHAGMGSTFFDFNKDGLTDIYVINYVDSIGFLYDANSEAIGFDHKAAKNDLYINQGDFVFDKLPADNLASGNGCGLAVTVIPSINQDGHGLYVANDFGEWVTPNEYFEFDADLSFRETASDYGLDVGIYAMGIAIGDYDNDDDFDLYLANLGDNPFLRHDGNGYTRIETELGVASGAADDGNLSTSWGTFFFDQDNDRDLDLFVANGFVDSPAFIQAGLRDENRFYLNQGDGSFADRGALYGLNSKGINRGAACGDIDNDGDVDLITAYVNYEPSETPALHYRLFRNDSPQGHFLSIDLIATNTGSDAYGAIAEVYLGDSKYIHYKYSSGSHASQSSKLLHCGLGDAELIDSLVIRWPDIPSESTYYNLTIDQLIRIQQGNDTYEVLGCNDANAVNYNPLATTNYGCKYATSVVEPKPADCGQVSIDISYGQIRYSFSELAQVYIYSLAGELLYTNESLGDSFQLNSGMYLVHFSTATCNTTHKIFIP